jgi:hypothetical protein
MFTLLIHLQYTPRPHTHPSLDSLKSALRSLGQMIREHGTPRSLGPLVIGVTGYVHESEYDCNV